MPRLKKKKLGVLNVKIHPHSPDLYANLFRDALELKRPKQIRGSSYIVLGWLRSEDIGNVESDLYGEAYRFVNIDTNLPWLNTDELEAEEFDPDNPPPIPEHLKPNLQKVPFKFLTDVHRFVFDTEHITPRSAQKALKGLLNDPTLVESYGEVDVELVSSRQQIDKMLELPEIRSIEILLTLPNPDDLSELERRVQERLRNGNIRREHTKQTGTKDQSIVPDEETKAKMSLSTSNGKTIVVGKLDNGTRVELSSKDHPVKLQYEQNENQSDISLVRNNARDAYARSSPQ